MRISSSLSSYLLAAAVMSSACDGDEAEAKAEGGAGEAKAASGAEAAPEAKPEAKPEMKVAAPQGSFEFTSKGEALSGTWKGTSAWVYDMAGFAHVGLNTDKLDMILDFNTQGTERPQVGKYPLKMSNLQGWTFALDEGMTDEDGWDSSNGELEITKVEGDRYEGRFNAKATRRDGSDPIEVSGTFVAYERPKKKKK